MIKKRCLVVLSVFSVISINIMNCNPEGEDSALLNNTNELKIHGENSGDFQFDHDSTLMITHLYTDSSFTGIPKKRLTQKWVEKDEQGNIVPTNTTESIFINAADSNDYYARAFIDINRNSEPDPDEPYDEWREDESNRLKVIPVKKESSWILRFKFDKTMEEY